MATALFSFASSLLLMLSLIVKKINVIPPLKIVYLGSSDLFSEQN